MEAIEEGAQRTPGTPEGIASRLEARHASAAEQARFEHGELVKIVARDGIPPDLGVGGVAVWLFSPDPGVWSHVLLLTTGGIEIIAQVPTDNLAKRDVA